MLRGGEIESLAGFCRLHEINRARLVKRRLAVVRCHQRTADIRHLINRTLAQEGSSPVPRGQPPEMAGTMAISQPPRLQLDYGFSITWMELREAMLHSWWGIKAPGNHNHPFCAQASPCHRRMRPVALGTSHRKVVHLVPSYAIMPGILGSPFAVASQFPTRTLPSSPNS